MVPVSKNYIGPWTLFGVVLLIAGVAIALPHLITRRAETTIEPVATTTIAVRTSAFDAIAIEAHAAYLFDITSRAPVFDRNADQALPLASLTKLMTALVVAETVPDLDATTIILTPEILSEDGDDGLLPYTHWTVRDLLEFMLVASSNDAAAALVVATEPYLGERTFIETMNIRAQELGLTNMRFLNATGLDINNETEPGAFGSARDVARLLSVILETKPFILEMTQKRQAGVPDYLRFTSLSTRNTNTILANIPWLLGSKTGFTDHAGGNLAIVFEVGLSHPVAAVVLGSSVTGRFTDMELLINATIEQL